MTYGMNQENSVCFCDMLSAISHTPYALRFPDAAGGAEAAEHSQGVEKQHRRTLRILLSGCASHGTGLGRVDGSLPNDK
jgi:hypothetical protein